MPLFKRSRQEEAATGRRLFAVATDSHGGAEHGLLNPATRLVRITAKGALELWEPEQSEIGAWLWYCVYLPAISDLADWAGDDEIIVVHAGDITNGDRYGGNLPETTREDQRTIAVDNLKPLLALPQVKKVRLVTGTEVHVPECAEAKIALALVEKTGKDVQSVHHAIFDVNGTLHDTAHHGAHPGTRYHLRGNVARLYLKDCMILDRAHGRVPAHVYWRGHYHDPVFEAVREEWRGTWTEHRLVVAPCLSGPTRHAIKVTRSRGYLKAGLVAAEIVDGRVCEIRPFIQTYDLRTEETL